MIFFSPFMIEISLNVLAHTPRMDGQVFLKFRVVDPLFTYKMVGNIKLNKNLKFDVVDHFMDKKRVDHSKINKKRVNNTRVKTNSIDQAV